MMTTLLDAKCGRPLTSNPRRTCRYARALEFESELDPDQWKAPACWTHMTLDERRQAILARRRFRDIAEPACWSWSAPPRQDYGDDEYDPRQREDLAAWQAGRCAVCGKFMDHRWRDRLVEDHDHATGLTRGLLCRMCNSSEGGNGDRHGAIRKYRIRPPTAILSMHIVYEWVPAYRAVSASETRAVVDRMVLPGLVIPEGPPVERTLGRVVELAPTFELSAEALRFLADRGPIHEREWCELSAGPFDGWPAAEIITAMDDTPLLARYITNEVLLAVTNRKLEDSIWIERVDFPAATQPEG